MNDLAALVVDSEYVDCVFERVYGRAHRPDPVKIRDYFANGRCLLWTRWYVKEPIGEPDDVREPRLAYLKWLRREGIRVIVCESKPISRSNDVHEENTCDFHVIEGIRLAEKKATTVIVASGDGHLKSALLRAHDPGGLGVEVFGDRQSISSTFEVDRYHYLEDVVAHGIDLTRMRRSERAGESPPVRKLALTSA